jgi:hypothetical protein
LGDLPTPDEVLQRVYDLKARIEQDPVGAREELKRYFADGKIKLDPRPDGVYVARWELLPVVLMVGTRRPAPGSSGGGPYTLVVAGACSANILRLESPYTAQSCGSTDLS